MKEIAIDVAGLTKSFGDRTVVRDLSLQVPKGEIFGFLGPNGSGKTTTIRLLCGLLTPDSGEGTCLGYDIRQDQDAIKSHVGYMTQRFSLYTDLSIRENLEFVARVYGMVDPRAAAKGAIDRLGLSGRAEQLAGELSGGWKQRLALGACILPKPQLLLLRPRASRCSSPLTTWTRLSAVMSLPISLSAICSHVARPKRSSTSPASAHGSSPARAFTISPRSCKAAPVSIW